MDQEFHTSQNHFKKIIQQQLERIEILKNAPLPTDYNKLDRIKVGIIGGDGIGPTITNVSQNILKSLLEQHKTKQIDLIPIPGLTIENRALAKQAIPNEILDEIKKDLKDNLGTIARSGTKKFVSNLSGDKARPFLEKIRFRKLKS